jgi:hypothetical protein
VWETLIAGALLLAMGAVGAAAALTPEAWLRAGFVLVALGLGFGVPAGAVYHWALRRALAPQGVLPPRWWLRPTALHGRLGPAARGPVLAWCGVGAAGFAVTVAGCLVLAAGLLRAL